MNSISKLANLLADWRQWTRTAERDEDGWESHYPQFGDLVDAATSVMEQGVVDATATSMLEQCWAISEEGEELADWAQAQPLKCIELLRSLASSPDPRVRWQVYEVLGFAGKQGEPVLRRGLRDSDAYCRRRALLALARLCPSDARELAEEHLRDEDPCIRQAAIEMVLASNDALFIAETRSRLGKDPMEHVRVAARQRLSL